MKTLRFLPEEIVNKYGVIIHDNKVKVCKGSSIGHINCNGIQIQVNEFNEVYHIDNHNTKEYIILWANIDYAVIRKAS